MSTPNKESKRLRLPHQCPARMKNRPCRDFIHPYVRGFKYTNITITSRLSRSRQASDNVHWRSSLPVKARRVVSASHQRPMRSSMIFWREESEPCVNLSLLRLRCNINCNIRCLGGWLCRQTQDAVNAQIFRLPLRLSTSPSEWSLAHSRYCNLVLEDESACGRQRCFAKFSSVPLPKMSTSSSSSPLFFQRPPAPR